MKAKLLKKLHRRYRWGFAKTDKQPLLFDKWTKEYTNFTFDVCLRMNRSEEKDVKISNGDFINNVFKSFLLRKYGWEPGRHQYKVMKRLVIKKYNIQNW